MDLSKTTNLLSLFHMTSVPTRTNGASDIEAYKIILLKCQPVSRPFPIMPVKLAFYAPSNFRSYAKNNAQRMLNSQIMLQFDSRK